MEYTEQVTKVKKVASWTLSQTYTDVIASVVYKVSATVNDTTYSREAVINLDWTKDHPDFVAYADATQEILLGWVYNTSNSTVESLKQMIANDVMFYSNEPDNIVAL